MQGISEGRENETCVNRKWHNDPKQGSPKSPFWEANCGGIENAFDLFSTVQPQNSKLVNGSVTLTSSFMPKTFSKPQYWGIRFALGSAK